MIGRNGAGQARRLAIAVADLNRIYRSLRLIRCAQEVAGSYPLDKINNRAHFWISHDLVSAGVCDLLRADALVAPTYRGHARISPKAGIAAVGGSETYGIPVRPVDGGDQRNA